jgi:hypothetical protein
VNGQITSKPGQILKVSTSADHSPPQPQLGDQAIIKKKFADQAAELPIREKFSNSPNSLSFKTPDQRKNSTSFSKNNANRWKTQPN